MAEDANPVGARLHALQLALTNKQMVEMIHQMEDPRSILNANFIPMATHESRKILFSVLLIKITNKWNEGIGQIFKTIDNEENDVLKTMRLFSTEFNYHYIRVISYDTKEYVNIGFLVHCEATDLDVMMAIKSITAGLEIFKNSTVFVLGFDENMKIDIPNPEINTTSM